MNEQLLKLSEEYTGLEKATPNCFSAPFLAIAQDNSPQLKKQLPEYIEGLEEGQFYCTSSRTVFKTPLRIIPVGFEPVFTKWKEKMGGFKGTFSPEDFGKIVSTLTRDGAKYTDSEGHEYYDTRQFYVILPDYPEEGTLIFPMKGGKIKASKKWFDGIKTTGEALFMHEWIFEAPQFVAEDKLTWFALGSITDAGPVRDEIVPQIISAVKEAKAAIAAPKQVLQIEDDQTEM